MDSVPSQDGTGAAGTLSAGSAAAGGSGRGRARVSSSSSSSSDGGAGGAGAGVGASVGRGGSSGGDSSGGGSDAATTAASPAEDAEARRNKETEMLLLGVDKTATQFATSRLRDENAALRSLLQEASGPSAAAVSSSLGVLIGSREMLRAEVERMEGEGGGGGVRGEG